MALAAEPLTHTDDPVSYLDRPLTDIDRTTLITNSWSPPPGFKFPVTNGRRYNSSWENDYSWLRYSKSKDAAFCAYCVLFNTAQPGRPSMEVFRTTGFQDWKNAMGKKRGMLACHQNSEAHRYAAVRASSYKSVMDGSTKDICSRLSDSYEKSVKERREILLSLIDVVVSLGKRNIPFRGHTWDKQTKREDGNFDFFVHWKSKFDPLLKHHLAHCSKNASYTSPAIQNEIIALAGDEIRDEILKSVKSARWYSIMADECTDVATIEQMALCLRFVENTGTVGKEYEVREEFIGMVELEKTDAESIFTGIVEYLNKCDLNLSNLRGQGYDGASNMSGKVSGVCSRIQQIQPLASYHHCRGHVLNLVLSSTCSNVPEIRNLFCSISWFMGASAKRKAILKRYTVSEDISDLVVDDADSDELSDCFVKRAKNRTVPKLCETRWSARVVTLSSFISKYIFSTERCCFREF